MASLASVCSVTHMPSTVADLSPSASPSGVAAFRRGRRPGALYLMLAWFAYLQAAPGLVIAHLRDELALSYSVGGLHVAAFAAGRGLPGGASARGERGRV